MCKSIQLELFHPNQWFLNKLKVEAIRNIWNEEIIYFHSYSDQIDS